MITQAIMREVEALGIHDTTTIYRLRDPRTQDIRYVGQTVWSLKTRLDGHVWAARARKGRRTRVADWVKELDDLGLRPVIESVQSVPTEVAFIREAQQVQSHIKQGCALLNRCYARRS